MLSGSEIFLRGMLEPVSSITPITNVSRATKNLNINIKWNKIFVNIRGKPSWGDIVLFSSL